VIYLCTGASQEKRTEASPIL